MSCGEINREHCLPFDKNVLRHKQCLFLDPILCLERVSLFLIKK